MSRSDYYASPFGIAFSFYMAAIAQIPRGGTIVDCPCGAGPAFRGLEPDQETRYLAVDLSPSMLRRARRRADARSLPQPNGAFVLGGNSRRGRLLIKPGRGDFGNPGTAEDVVRWLADAGFATPETRTSGSMLFFDARLG